MRRAAFLASLVFSGLLTWGLAVAPPGLTGDRSPPGGPPEPPAGTGPQPPGGSDSPGEGPGPGAGEAAALPVVGSRANLVRLLQTVGMAPVPEFGLRRIPLIGSVPAGAGLARSAAKSAAPARAPGAAPGYSRTNVQVEGVDEADLVKTDGRYIYQVNGRRVLVIRAHPPEELVLEAAIALPQADSQPLELYADGIRLAVIAQSYGPLPGEGEAAGAGAPPGGKPFPRPASGATQLLIYDLGDPAAPRLARTVEVEGYYLSSRRVGPALYLVTTRPVDWRVLEPGAPVPDPETPAYRDSAAGGGWTAPGYDRVRYFPDSVEPTYLTVAALDLDRPAQPAAVVTLLGGGETVYASAANLYVAVTRWQAEPGTGSLPPSPGTVPDRRIKPLPPGGERTVIHRFALAGGRVEYRGRGEVPGRVLNQFSLDEHAGHLRVAVTEGDPGFPGPATRNAVYILDGDMKVVGRLTDIAPGERIYSARFLGERAYLVTFKKVDPFFVLDLADPRAPRVLGYLKIPGYSDYLHPYDEHHVLGFGKDTAEDPAGGDFAYYQGLKVALFDVRDVAHPVERFRVLLGARGSDSPLLHDHKALLFDRRQGLLAFPALLTDPVPGGDPRAYGPLSFQGALVFHLDRESGFRLRGRITHLTEEDLLLLRGDPVPCGPRGGCPPPEERFVERCLYIGDTLYTLSRGMVQAHGLADLAERGRLALPPAP